MTYISNFTIQMAAILFWQILTLKFIFQLGKQFFQIQHIQFMKSQLSNYFYHEMPAGVFFDDNMPQSITKYIFSMSN